MEPLIVTYQTQIKASAAKVWNVLTDPEFIKQWDDLPANYTGGLLKPGSVLEREGQSILTVSEFEPNKTLRLKMFLPKIDLPATAYDVNYKYSLTENNGVTTLAFEIGDFAPLPDAQDYYESSIDFVETARKKIKQLAEK